MESPLITRKQTAKLYGVSLMTLYRWARAGRLVPIHLDEGTVRYRKSDVEAFMKTKIPDELLTSGKEVENAESR